MKKCGTSIAFLFVFLLFAGCESVASRAIISMNAEVAFSRDASERLAADVLNGVQKRFEFPEDAVVSRHGVTLIEKVYPDLGAVIVGSRVKEGRLEFWINGQPGIQDTEIAKNIRDFILSKLKEEGVQKVEVDFKTNPFA